MQEEIERALAPLVGRPLFDAGRVGAMLWLQIGDRRGRPEDQRGAREVGEYALHVSCAWRLIGPHGIYVASGDLFTPADPMEEPGDFVWDAPGANWCDVRLQAFLTETAGAPRVVSSVSSDEIGSLRVFLGDDFVLDVFPDSSDAAHIETEFWRLLQPGTAGTHVVVGSSGVDLVPGA
jgi:hypothetical protein